MVENKVRDDLNDIVFKVNLNDHPPAHVHVFVGGTFVGRLLIKEGFWMDNLPSISRGKKRAIEHLRESNEAKLVEMWKTIHGQKGGDDGNNES